MTLQTTAPVFLSPRKAAEACDVSKPTIYRWAAKGLITLHHQGARTFIDVDELKNLITGKGQGK